VQAKAALVPNEAVDRHVLNDAWVSMILWQREYQQSNSQDAISM
jgi:hypothetical protein